MRAEIIVLVEPAESAPATSPLAILDALQDRLHLSKSAADDWIDLIMSALKPGSPELEARFRDYAERNSEMVEFSTFPL